MAAITSAASGLWSATGTWVGGVVPGAADTVTIAKGHTVTVDGAYTVGGDVVGGLLINGTLKASRSASSTLTLRTTPTHGTAGVWNWGTEADPIPAGVTATVVVNDSATMAARKYTVNPGAATAFGGFSARGAAKAEITELNLPALSTDTVIRVSDGTGWAIGDKLAIDSPSEDPALNFWRQVTAISAVSGAIYDVTVSAAVGVALLAGHKMINLTRNVRFVGSSPASFAACPLVVGVQAAQGASTIEIGWLEIVGTGGGQVTATSSQASGIWIGYAATSVKTKAIKEIIGISAHDILSISGAAVTLCAAGGSIATLYGNSSARVQFSRCVGSSGRLYPVFLAYNGASATLNNCSVIGSTAALSSGYAQGAVACKIDGGYYSCLTNTLVHGNGISVYLQDVVFGAVSRYVSSSVIAFGDIKFSSCHFLKVAFAVNTAGSGAVAAVYHDSCTYPVGAMPAAFVTAPLADSGDGWSFAVRNANGVTEQYRHTNAGLTLRDNSISYRGLSSVQIDPWFSGAPLSYSRPIGATTGQTVTVVGYLRFNAAYGTATPPSVTLSGLGGTPATFTAPAAADAWHQFTLSITNTSGAPGEMTLTATGQSTAGPTAQAWLDGVIWPDYVTSVRHFGYLWDGLPNVTADPRCVLTEAVALALPVAVDHTAQTITVTGALTNADVLQACLADLCQTANLTRSVHITGSAAFTTTYTVILSGAGAIAGVYTDAAGVHVRLLAGLFPAGARVQVFSTGDDVELFNAVLPSLGLSLPMTWTADRTLRVRMARDGFLPLQTVTTLTASGGTILDAPQSDNVYTANGVTGSAVTEFAPDAWDMQIDAADVDGVTSVQRLYAWMRYYDTTAVGIASEQFSAISAVDQINYTLADIKLDNTKTAPLHVVGGYLSRADGDTVIAATSGSIQMDPGKAYIAPNSTPTPAQVADGILARSLAGGMDGGRTVRDALRASRNRTEIVGNALTVYSEDDTTPAWTAAISTGQRDALIGVDPT